MADASSCGGINTIPGISFFTTAASVVLAIGTTTLHSLIMRSIYKLRRKKLNIFFYKLILKISFADILTGLLTDPYSIIFHTQEGLLLKPIEIKVIHVMLYLLGSVPLATLVLLCIDRVLALLLPFTYRNGPQKRTAWYLVVSTWFISAVQISAYFQLGFITYLVIFAAVNIAGASLGLIVTSFIFHKRMVRDRIRNKAKQRSGEHGQEMHAGKQTSSRKEKPKRDERLSGRERSATKAFQIMAVVNVVSYLPTCFATAYMNACTNCNCTIVHSMRDIAIVSILAGPLFRAVTFLSCLKPLRSGFCRRKSTDSSGQPVPNRAKILATRL